jgi:predicted transcriptional regulator
LSSDPEPPPSPTELDELKRTYEALAARITIIESSTSAMERVEPGPGFSDKKLATIAESIYRARRRRLKLFNANLFGEPAWDMLLDMFIKTARGERLSTTSLCIAADVPQATGLRWIAQLEEQGLLSRRQVVDDRRLKIVEITPEGYRLMRQYVTEGIARFDMPIPD